MRKGWCPSLYEPMAAADGLLVRVKPPAGRIAAPAARALAQAARAFGNGTIEATSRGNLQVRGLAPDTVPGFAAAMVAAGLADPDPAVERQRCVIYSPFGCDHRLATLIEAALVTVPDLAPKFCVAVGVDAAADIRVHTEDAAHVVTQSGQVLRCQPDETVSVVRSLALSAAGQRLPVVPQSHDGSKVGAMSGGMMLALPFGAVDGDLLAGLAERFAGGTLRITPWRSIFLPGVADPAGLLAASAGLISDPADPRLRIAACIGSDGCASGTVPARRDAMALAGATWSGILHVSGCAKGCAHPGPAAVTLVGEAGAYGLVRRGAACDPPTRRGRALDLLAAS